MNVLLTSAGRRNYLVGFFKEANRGRVLVADCDPTAAVMAEADESVLVPPINDPEYIGRLIAVCGDHQIDLIFPLNDLDLGVLEQHKGRFEENGVRIVVSNKQVLDICADKVETSRFLQTHGIGLSVTCFSLETARAALERGELTFPLIIKPRWGSGSVALQRVEDANDLPVAFQYVEKTIRRSPLRGLASDINEAPAIIQPFIDGEEFHLDVVNDLEGRHQTTLCKRKLAMRSGETDKALTVESAELSELGARIAGALRHIGNLDCDVLSGPEGNYVIDMNPRFGGGYPFAHIAGANIPAAILAWAEGAEARSEWLKATPGVLSAKCDRLVNLTRREWS